VIPFDQIIGQGRPVELLRRMTRAGRIPQALLLHGPEGLGKGAVARTFAASLLCERGEEEPCGACASCRLADGARHPDLLVVTRLERSASSGARHAEPEGDEGDESERGELRTFIEVAQIRELVRLASLAPRRAARRLFVLDPAEAMNASAQNALLKTLEEPPGSAVLVLVASRPHLLLPTVRSRSIAVPFAPLSTPALAEALERRGSDRREAESRAALSEGCPGRAIALDLAVELERRDALLDALDALTSPSPALDRLPALAAELAAPGAAGFGESLDRLSALLRDAARAAAGSPHDALRNTDVGPRIEAIGRRLGAIRAAALVGAIDRLRGQLRLNLNRTLVAEALLAAVAGGPLPAGT
jgi:DNA polymerase-3 subunit delta'